MNEAEAETSGWTFPVADSTPAKPEARVMITATCAIIRRPSVKTSSCSCQRKMPAKLRMTKPAMASGTVRTL